MRNEVKSGESNCADLIDGNLLKVAMHARDCASSWEPSARLIGNCRACDLAHIFAEYVELKHNGKLRCGPDK